MNFHFTKDFSLTQAQTELERAIPFNLICFGLNEKAIDVIRCSRCKVVPNFNSGFLCTSCKKPFCSHCLPDIEGISLQTPCGCKGERETLKWFYKELRLSPFANLRFKCPQNCVMPLSFDELSNFADHKFQCPCTRVTCKFCSTQIV